MADINFLPYVSLFPEIKHQSADKDVFWKNGQVIEGTVLEKLADNIYLIRADGKEVKVLSPYLFDLNQRMTMEIQDFKENRYMVKLLNFAPKGEDSAIKAAIDRIGAPDTALNRILVRSILAQEITLTPEILQKAQNALETPGGNFLEKIETVLLALKWRLPLTTRTLEVLNSLVLGWKQTERGQLSQLNRFIQDLGLLSKTFNPENTGRGSLAEAFLRPGQPPPAVLSEEGKNLFMQIRHMLDELVLKPEEGSPKLTGQLRSLLRSQLPVAGPPGEKISTLPAAASLPAGGIPGTRVQLAGSGERTFTLAATAPPPAGGIPGTGIQQAPAEPGGKTLAPEPGPKQPFTGLKNAAPEEQTLLTTVIKGNHSENPSDPMPLPENIKAFSSLLEKFGSLIKELKAAVKEKSAALPGAPELVARGSLIEKQLAAQQIFQSIAGEKGEQEYLYFNIPFIRHGQTDTYGELRIIKDTGGKRLIDPGSFRMIMLLNTANLGPLVLEIKVLNKDITANIKVSEEWIAGVLDQAWPELQESFQDIGYSLGDCSCKVGVFPGNLQPRGFELKIDAEKQHLLDVQV